MMSMLTLATTTPDDNIRRKIQDSQLRLPEVLKKNNLQDHFITGGVFRV